MKESTAKRGSGRARWSELARARSRQAQQASRGPFRRREDPDPPPASAPCPPGRSRSGAFPPGLSVVQQAVDWTGLPQVPMHARARLVTDHGSGDLAGAFEDSLRALGIRLSAARPITRRPRASSSTFHETLKARLTRLVDRDWMNRAGFSGELVT